MKIDLHCHTTASDGTLTPEELVLRAATMQVDVLAITDHDTLAGLAAAHNAILQHKLTLTLINGVEISTRWQGKDIHIVGLNLDIESAVLIDFIEQQQCIRQQRAQRIADKLERTGFSNIYQQAAAQAKGGEITRAHFARALVQHHGLGTIEQAFKRFLGRGKVGDVKAQWPGIEKAVAAIHEGQGHAILAHPLKYDLTTKWLRRLVTCFVDANGDAIEVAGPGVMGQKQSMILDIASTAGLKGSVGSDFHSPGRWTELGRFSYTNSVVAPLWQEWSLTT